MAMPEGAMRLHSAMAIATTPMGIQKPKLTFPDDFELRWASFQCHLVIIIISKFKFMFEI